MKNNNRMYFRVRLSVILAALILLSLSVISQTETNPPVKGEQKPATIANSGPVDPKELESLLDAFLGKKMEEYHIPGLVFVLVKDGKIFLSKGYGYSDLKKKIPISPEETIFRVGSVSKVFTATAAMQLYEQGRLDLKANVNDYLKPVKLEENYPKPVTLADLLSHSAGLRGSAIGSVTHRQSDQVPLGKYLAAHMPSRFSPPGSLINYSNHGYYIVGHLIEAVSGLSFEQYVADNILGPLGMEKSSFVVSSRLSPNLAKCYAYSNGNFEIVPEEYSILVASPAGSLIATADDMARFMIAQLQGGYYQDRRILRESTCRLMQRQQFTNDPRLPGTCYGFYEYRGFNLRAIFHDGDVTGFSSRLFLLPDQNLGFFVCDNTGNSVLRMELTDGLLEHYYPVTAKPIPAKATSDMDALGQRLAGSYRSVRIDLDHYDKWVSMTSLLDISATAFRSWTEVEPHIFQQPKRKTRMAFREENGGDIRYLFFDAQQMPLAYEKLGGFESVTVQSIISAFFILVFLSTGVVWPIWRKVRARRKPLLKQAPKVRSARWLAVTISVMFIIFIIGFVLSFDQYEDQLDYGTPWVITFFLAIPVINCVLIIGLTVLAVLAWIHREGEVMWRLGLTLVTLTCIGFVLFLNYWNLLGFRY